MSPDQLEAARLSAKHQLATPSQPWELETDLGYPGAPKTSTEDGGKTLRRLRGAYAREKNWRTLAGEARLKSCLSQLFREESNSIYLSQAHHNCLMTKTPKFSSDTGWHQDSRYWRFNKPELITAWFALGDEHAQNGGLWVVPGSHRLNFDAKLFDDQVFLLENKSENQALIAQAQSVELNAGDMLLFHCQLLHRASRNYSEQSKLSLAFTYHNEGVYPLENTRSSSLAEVQI